jgi:hypothetical protein
MCSETRAYHLSQYQLRQCEQTIYTDQKCFAKHLHNEHGALGPEFLLDDLGVWQRVQFLEYINGKGLIRTLRPNPSDCCASTVLGYNFTFVEHKNLRTGE